MKKYLIGLLLVLLLTACGTSEPTPTEPETEPISSAEETTSESANLETDNDAATETDNDEEAADVEASEESEEDTAVTAADGPTYEPATTIPEAAEPKATDHTKGAEDPIITIIEYGDFQ